MFGSEGAPTSLYPTDFPRSWGVHCAVCGALETGLISEAGERGFSVGQFWGVGKVGGQGPPHKYATCRLSGLRAVEFTASWP